MNVEPLHLDLSLNEFRPLLLKAAEETGVVLDFLMRSWNGRFATYNVGRQADEVVDERRGVRDEVRRYQLIGRVKATTQTGVLRLALSPPTSCDPTQWETDQQLWEQFVTVLLGYLEPVRVTE